MKNLIIMIILVLFTSCASSKPKVDKTRVHPDFVPYVQNFLINYNHPSIITKLKSGYELKIKYNDIGYAPQYPGVCHMSKNIQDRTVMVNKKFWDQYPDKRAQYITHLIHMCGADKPESIYGDLYYRGF